jgi:hypothetical protein
MPAARKAPVDLLTSLCHRLTAREDRLELRCGSEILGMEASAWLTVSELIARHGGVRRRLRLESGDLFIGPQRAVCEGADRLPRVRSKASELLA